MTPQHPASPLAPEPGPLARLRALEDRRAVRELPHLVGAGAHAAVVAGCLWSWSAGLWPVTVVLWLVVVWLNHAALARLHEAAHRLLSNSRRWNELQGLAIGTLALTPLSVYRHVHAQHHAHLGDPEDPEFWPYNLPQASLRRRRTYAWLELTLGWLVTPALYSLRTARAWPRLRPRLRRRLVAEWTLLPVAWAAVIATALHLELGWALLVGHVVPAWLTGSVQTLRKFTEHLGKAGDSIHAMTRTVAYRGPLGRALSASQLYVDHHATHHRFPAIPCWRLPEATAIVYGELTDEPLYPHHGVALREALGHLRDPRIGPQWAVAD